jgi:hypothetical protein
MLGSKSAVVAMALGLGCTLTAMQASAATGTGNVTVQTTLTSACEVSAAAATIDFGSVVTLASSGNKTADSGSTFQVACSSDLSPKIYSTTARAMTDGGVNSLPFDLCLAACTGSNSLPSAQGSAEALSMVQDGTLQPVKLYGSLLASDFKGLPAGSYSKIVTINVDY